MSGYINYIFASSNLFKRWRARSSIIMRLLLFLIPPLGNSIAQYIVAPVLNNANVGFWSASAGAQRTSVRTLPAMPTLVYNCAIVPALCANVEQLRPGAAGGGHSEIMGWDPARKRKKARNKAICPSDWKEKTVCPRTGQPPIHPLGITNDVPPWVEQGGFAVLKMGPSGQYERTGLMMTCDEFPPAMAIQGGTGPPGGPVTGATYCAPSKLLYHS